MAAHGPSPYILRDEPIELCPGRRRIELEVANGGDRPIQVGSHYHFADVNPALRFDRTAARGMRLDIPAGTAIRFEPGDTQTVRLVPFAGARVVYGGHGLVDGPLDSPGARERFAAALAANGFDR